MCSQVAAKRPAVPSFRFDKDRTLVYLEPMTTPPYTLDWILPYVRLALQRMHDITYRRYAEALWSHLEQAGIPGVVSTSDNYDRFRNDSLPLELRALTTEAFFFLFHKGYITPMPPDSHLNSPGLSDFRATKRGMQWLSGTEPFPEEAAQYLAFLKRNASSLDSVIEQYVSEALAAFERDAYFATAVMVGAASEKAIYLLATSLLVALKVSLKRTRLEGLLKKRSLNQLLEYVRETIEAACSCSPPLIPYAVSEGAAPHLQSLFEAIRTQRNDAVHPMNAVVSAASVRLLLHSFPYALNTTEKLRSWFDANPASL